MILMMLVKPRAYTYMYGLGGKVISGSGTYDEAAVVSRDEEAGGGVRVP